VRALGEVFDSFSALAVFAAQFGVISAVFDLLNLFQERFLRQKRVEGVLSFDDVARLARASLAAYPDVRQAEKAAYRAIMIDEFQDNNALQRDMLFLLAEKPECCAEGVPKPEYLSPDKLFFVGDEKQSIYRFRGADVSVFRALKTDLARSRESVGGTDSESGTELRLKNNYRSAKELIGVFNALFGGSAYSPSGDAETGRFAGIFLPNTPEAPSPVYEAEYVPVRHPAANTNAHETANAGAEYAANAAKSPNGINTAGAVSFNEEKTSADKAGGMPAVPSPDISANDKSAAGRIPPECRICVLDKSAEADGTDERGDLLSAAESEAAFVARQIRALTEQGGRTEADVSVR
ncbi:UvrD-helicase domain-containing protein, partial [Treponema endosymbiont of Eucomonympha sp.]|uniref:UvrD-helicase domain-containing protein n=1 Tax=Treponema endosymbiont of Eucomonympha sp. TaxID=1580831 RepID=UPI00139685C1